MSSLSLIRLILWSCLLFVTACAVQPPIPEPAAEAAWLLHRSSVEVLTHWQVNGRVAVRAEDDGWNANFDWQQQGDEYRIRLRGPFGQGAVELHGNSEGVWLKRADQPAVFAVDPETLLLRETGWRLPVSGLGSWLRGLPLDGVDSHYQWDEQGRLSHIEQNGWQIDYSRYQQSGAFDLPVRLRLERDSLQVRFVIDGWQTS